MIIDTDDHLNPSKADHFVAGQGAIKRNLWMFGQFSRYIYSVHKFHLSLNFFEFYKVDRVMFEGFKPHIGQNILQVIVALRPLKLHLNLYIHEDKEVVNPR